MELLTDQRMGGTQPHAEPTPSTCRIPQPFEEVKVTLDAYLQLNPLNFSGNFMDDDP